MNYFWPNEKRHSTQVWATTLIELAMSRGADIELLLRGTGLFKQDLTTAEHQISSEQFGQLVNNSLKHTRSQDLSFMLGRRLMAAQQTKFVSLLQHSKNLGQAARVFQLYQSSLFPFSFGEIKQFEQDVYFIVNPAIQNQVQTFMFEVLCAAIYQVSKRFCGKLIPYHFSFEQARPRNIYQFEENLGNRLLFEQPLNWIKIDSQYLAAAIEPAPSFTRVALMQQCQQARHLSQNMGILQYLYKAILAGDIANLEQAAEYLHTSQATLKRKLKLTGVSFQQLQDAVRKQQAIFELVVCKQKNGAVAKKLHFNDVTNFRRAFKRWTGLTPAQLKAD